MKVVILAGGLGSRLAEETGIRPKPMVEIGGRPILWHIMKSYSHYGFEEFVVCLGYKGSMIKEYFLNYAVYSSDVTVDLAAHSYQIHQNRAENWKVTLVDTGASTMTGGRLRRVRHYLGEQTFLMTYGDGLANIDIRDQVKFHKSHGLEATVTASRLPGRFGALQMDGVKVERMVEKPQGESGWINGGFFVLEPSAIDRVAGDSTIWEREPMEDLAASGQLAAYTHQGFWQCMDTVREKSYLEELWTSGQAPWKVWSE